MSTHDFRPEGFYAGRIAFSPYYAPYPTSVRQVPSSYTTPAEQVYKPDLTGMLESLADLKARVAKLEASNAS